MNFRKKNTKYSVSNELWDKAKAGDPQALAEIEQLTRFLRQWITSQVILPAGLTYDDALSQAYIYLDGAIQKYDPGKGSSFNSFATMHIRRELRNYANRFGCNGRSYINGTVGEHLETLERADETDVLHDAITERISAMFGKLPPIRLAILTTYHQTIGDHQTKIKKTRRALRLDARSIERVLELHKIGDTMI